MLHSGPLKRYSGYRAHITLKTKGDVCASNYCNNTQQYFPSPLPDQYIGIIYSASPYDEPLKVTFKSRSVGVIMQHRSELIALGEFWEQSNRTLNTTISTVPLETRLHLQNRCRSQIVQSFTSNVLPSEPLLCLIDILTGPLKSYLGDSGRYFTDSRLRWL